MHLSGTISPEISDLSHVYLVYGTGYSPTILSNFSAVELGDFSAGQTTPFSVYADAEYDHYFGWLVFGLHGDISGGEYNETINGVAAAHPRIEQGDNWDSHIYYTDIEDMFDYLFDNDLANLGFKHSYYWYTDGDFTSGGIDFDLWNFSTADQNGEMSLAFEMVPEPVTLVLFSVGGIFVVASRRKKQ